MEPLEEVKNLSSFRKAVIAGLILIIGFGTAYLVSRHINNRQMIEKGIKELYDQFKPARDYMIKHHIRARGIYNPKVLDAMDKVPRERFVLENLISQAYNDNPLPIGYGQTISQPFIVALMTQLLEPDDEDVALEVGTGSGYQAAVLSEIVNKVYTVEIISELGIKAKEKFEKIGYNNIETKIGDGYYGWEEHAPYDCIVVTAAAPQIPPPLIKQLKNGGKMAIPVGHPYLVQHLTLVEKTDDGDLLTKLVMPVRFVPFVRDKKGYVKGQDLKSLTELYNYELIKNSKLTTFLNNSNIK